MLGGNRRLLFVTCHEINAADRWSHVRLPAARTGFVHDGTPADRATEGQQLTYRLHPAELCS
jgi:hypothetical protein